ncbi:MAG TPA: peptide deformylase [Gammaproteobacteria bacterium]|jgi:peptide deformylase|nr:peptide deformylase [Gammaproteobacteria bacterium]
MALRDILIFPHAHLRKVAKPVQTFDAALATLVEDMFETMYAAPGIGLAATQIDVHQQVIVMDISEDKNEPRVFINAELLSQEGEVEHEEGCLSIPGIYEKVKRPARVRVRAQDQHGETYELDADGLLAVCIQHEIDHLNGKLFIDYLSALKRDRIRKKLEKQTRRAG